MASTDARALPKQNVALRITFPIRNTSGVLVSGATGLDTEISKDAAAFADATNEATEIGSTGIYYLDITSTEMNAYTVVAKTTTTSASVNPIVHILYPATSNGIDANLVAIVTASTTVTKMKAALDLITEGTVDGTGTNSVTQIESATVAFTSTANPLHWGSAWMYFETGANAGSRRAITNFVVTGGRARFTVEAFPEAPAGDDAFAVI